MSESIIDVDEAFNAHRNDPDYLQAKAQAQIDLDITYGSTRLYRDANGSIRNPINGRFDNPDDFSKARSEKHYEDSLAELDYDNSDEDELREKISFLQDRLQSLPESGQIKRADQKRTLHDREVVIKSKKSDPSSEVREMVRESIDELRSALEPKLISKFELEGKKLSQLVRLQAVVDMEGDTELSLVIKKVLTKKVNSLKTNNDPEHQEERDANIENRLNKIYERQIEIIENPNQPVQKLSGETKETEIDDVISDEKDAAGDEFINVSLDKPEDNESKLFADPELVAYNINGSSQKQLAYRFNKVDTIIDWSKHPLMQTEDRRAVIQTETGLLYLKGRKLYDFKHRSSLGLEDNEEFNPATIGHAMTLTEGSNDEKMHFWTDKVLEVAIAYKVADSANESDEDLLSNISADDNNPFVFAEKMLAELLATSGIADSSEVAENIDHEAEANLLPVLYQPDPNEPPRKRRQTLINIWASINTRFTRHKNTVREYLIAPEHPKRRKAAYAVGALALLGSTFLVGDLLSSSDLPHHLPAALNHSGTNAHLINPASGLNPIVSRSSGSPNHVHHFHASHAKEHLKHLRHTVKAHMASFVTTGHGENVSDQGQVLKLSPEQNSIWSNVASALPEHGIAASNSNVAIVTDWVVHTHGLTGNQTHFLANGWSFHMPPEHVLRELLKHSMDA